MKVVGGVVVFLFILSVNLSQAAEPFVLIELFTSEGCSSCPPADQLLTDITREARAQKKNIFTLSFSVDYWDRLGWKDPFSRKEFTERQYQYAKILGESSVYTPQMVINGSVGFVGSNADRAAQNIEKYFKVTPSAHSITLKTERAAADDFAVHYSVDEVSTKAVLNLALVERGLISYPNTGENAGRKLPHDNVVRDFRSVPLKEKAGSIHFSVQNNDLAHLSVVAFLQDRDSYQVLAAEETDLKEK